MKILSIGNFGTGWDGSICDEKHIALALADLGHSVIQHPRGDSVIPQDNYDFALISQWDGYPDDLIQFMRQVNPDTPIVYWAFDYQADGQEWHERLVKEADLYLSKRIADSKYPNWQWLSQDFAPHFLDRSHQTATKDIDALFTGSYLPWATERNETIREVARNYNLVIHSVNGWPEEWGLDVRPPIMDEGLPELYARAKIVLSIDHTLEAGYWSDRNAQAMACGAFVLFRYVPLSEARFGNLVGYFYSVVDCLNKISQYLKDDGYRNEVSEQAYKYAQENLKVKDRCIDLINIVRQYV